MVEILSPPSQLPPKTLKCYNRYQVSHTYVDRSHESNNSCTIPINKSALAKQPFPVKLHKMLSLISLNEGVVGWLPHGRAFLVKHQDIFVQNIMPAHFKQTKWASFQRQLNLYGFRRLTKGPDAGAYYHELFLRDRHFLALRIVRFKLKGTWIKGASNPDEEPDFYSMPFVGRIFETQKTETKVKSVRIEPNLPQLDQMDIEPTPIRNHAFNTLEEERSFKISRPPLKPRSWSKFTPNIEKPNNNKCGVISSVSSMSDSNEDMLVPSSKCLKTYPFNIGDYTVPGLTGNGELSDLSGDEWDNFDELGGYNHLLDLL